MADEEVFIRLYCAAISGVAREFESPANNGFVCYAKEEERSRSGLSDLLAGTTCDKAIRNRGGNQRLQREDYGL